MRQIYLDNNATTRVAPEVLDAMLPCYQKAYGNASSVHAFGQEAKGLLDNARQQLAHLLNAEANEIVFTSGGTESDNLAIRGVAEASARSRKHIITTRVEHHAVLHTCQALQKSGIDVTYLPVNSEGLVDPQDVRKAITPDTILISVMHSNNEIGTTQALKEIGQIALEHDVYFHTDAVQAAGKLPLDVDDLNADLLSVAGHKFHAPKGVGALYVRKGTRLRPLFFGGAHERNRRAGTENVPQIVGLGAAAELAGNGLEDRARSIGELRDYFEHEVCRRIRGWHSMAAAPRGSPTPQTCVSNGQIPKAWSSTSTWRALPAPRDRLAPRGRLNHPTCFWPWGFPLSRLSPRYALACRAIRPAMRSRRSWKFCLES